MKISKVLFLLSVVALMLNGCEKLSTSSSTPTQDSKPGDKQSFWSWVCGSSNPKTPQTTKAKN